MKLNLDHIHLRCENYEASIDFFKKMFNSVEVTRFEVGGWPVVKISLGDTFISLSPKKPDVNIDRPALEPHWGVYHIAFIVENLADTVAELKKKGGAFAVEFAPMPNGYNAAFFIAVDGLQIEFLEKA